MSGLTQNLGWSASRVFPLMNNTLPPSASVAGTMNALCACYEEIVFDQNTQGDVMPVVFQSSEAIRERSSRPKKIAPEVQSSYVFRSDGHAPDVRGCQV